jgi:hypothetical protein
VRLDVAACERSRGAPTDGPLGDSGRARLLRLGHRTCDTCRRSADQEASRRRDDLTPGRFSLDPPLLLLAVAELDDRGGQV